MTNTQLTFLSEKMKTMYIEFADFENQKDILFYKILEYLNNEDQYYNFMRNIVNIYREDIDKETYREYSLKIISYYIFYICYDEDTIKYENKNIFDLYIKKLKYIIIKNIEMIFIIIIMY